MNNASGKGINVIKIEPAVTNFDCIFQGKDIQHCIPKLRQLVKIPNLQQSF
jgi:hypothetical protein